MDKNTQLLTTKVEYQEFIAVLTRFMSGIENLIDDIVFKESYPEINLNALIVSCQFDITICFREIIAKGIYKPRECFMLYAFLVNSNLYPSIWEFDFMLIVQKDIFKKSTFNEYIELFSFKYDDDNKPIFRFLNTAFSVSTPYFHKYVEILSRVCIYFENISGKKVSPVFNFSYFFKSVSRRFKAIEENVDKLVGKISNAKNDIKSNNNFDNDDRKTISDKIDTLQILLAEVKRRKDLKFETDSKLIETSSTKFQNNIDDFLKNLNGLIGLTNVKEEITSLVNFIKIQKLREKSGLKLSALSNHIVFTGNPGTGKTTVARIVAKIYKCLGIISSGHFIETDRSGLIAEYVGHTAIKVNKLVDQALGGVLFIDEAYSIVGDTKDDYGKEAVATLIKRIEDDRDKFVVIMAGYTNEMKTFIDTNPGFKSRFNKNIVFADYTASEMVAIFEFLCSEHEYTISESARPKIVELFETAFANKDKGFGNGRYVRNVFEKTLEKQANRLSKTTDFSKENLTTLIEEDVFFYVANNAIII